MISRIEATRYRCFEMLDVDIDNFSVLVGANGSGKTTLLDIPGLLGDMLRERNISTAFLVGKEGLPPRARSLEELVYKQQGDYFILAIEAKLPDHLIPSLLEGYSDAVKQQQDRWPSTIRYEVRFQIYNQRELNVQNEYLFVFSDNEQPERRTEDSAGNRLHGEFTPKRDWRFIIKREYGSDAEFKIETKRQAKPKEANVAASQLAMPRVQFESADDHPAARWMLDLLLEDTVFLNPEWQQLRSASPPGLPNRLISSGMNMPWLAMELKEKDETRFNSWKQHVSLALPQVTDVDVCERQEDHHAYYRVTYNEGHSVTSSGLSDGTLRILTYTLLPYLLEPPKFLVLEEPENGIHPKAIEAVMEGVSCMYESQVMVSSHSTVVLARTDLDDLLVARLNDEGASEVVQGKDHPRLVDWQGNVDLGSLFAAGVLG